MDPVTILSLPWLLDSTELISPCLVYFQALTQYMFYLHPSFPLLAISLCLSSLTHWSLISFCISSVQFSSLSLVQPFETPWTAAHQASQSITNSRSLFQLIHRVGDAIQPSHPLSSPYRPAFCLSQNQGLFQWVTSLHQVAKVSEFQFQHQSFQWVFRTEFL